jgi:hypothetical protein
MNKRAARGLATVVMGAILASLSVAAAASDVEISSESIAVADDGTTSYSGAVIIRVPLTTSIKFTSKTTTEADGAQVLEGDVQIVIEDMLITTQKATVTRKDAVIIEMDEAESKPAKASAG